MHKLNRISQIKSKRTAISNLALLSAKISLRFGVIWREFMEYYKQHLVKEAKKQNPGYSIVELSGRTGIDRRFIKSYLNNDEPRVRPSKINLTLQLIKQTCEKNDSYLIRKSGPFESFESICNITASGTLTPKAIASELIRLGNLKENGKFYKLLNWKYTTESDENYLSYLTIEMDRMTDTTIENVNNSNNRDNKKVQRNVYSTQINPDKFNIVNKEIKDVLYDSHDKIYKILTSHEDKVPLNTYPTFGASMFTFGPGHNNQLKE